MVKTIFIALLLVFGILAVPSARAAGYCAAHPNEDALHALPMALVPAAQAAFGLHGLSTAQTRRMTVTRCMGGKVYACFIGANLPCGKANKARNLPAATDWCENNPNADFVPAYISGHDSVYAWRCRFGLPVHVGPPAVLDQRGFFKCYWKNLG
ncbi:MAG: hypothetical protein KGQ79_07605 [Proteobacteria bacterium]|nr:hypothetical protein [Pseudomonadota bacterium]MBU6425849.1 hypothetical protein [Rhodospirillales bacterium]